jgi:hypothetical protein
VEDTVRLCVGDVRARAIGREGVGLGLAGSEPHESHVRERLADEGVAPSLDRRGRRRRPVEPDQDRLGGGSGGRARAGEREGADCCGTADETHNVLLGRSPAFPFTLSGTDPSAAARAGAATAAVARPEHGPGGRLDWRR